MGKRVIFFDSILIFLSFLGSYFLRFYTSIFPFKGIAPLEPYIKITIFIVFGWILIFNSIGLYKERIYPNPVIELSKIIEGSFWACIFLMAGTFLYRGFSYSRLAIGFGCLFSFISISIFHSLLIKKISNKKRKILILGKGKEIDILKKRIFLKEIKNFELNHFEEGNIEEIEKIKPEFLIITREVSEKIDLKKITQIYKVKVYNIPQISEKFFSGIFEDIDGLPLIASGIPPMNKFPNYLLKRVFDLIFGSIFLLIFCLLLPFISLLIKIDSKGPIFFKQDRIGKDGKIFKMFKFRTMKYPYSDLSPFTLRDDPRLTKIGKFLRRYNIDELPQIFNVLKGDMSLVGPRPISKEDRAFIELPEFQLRISVKPGITGWAQIHGLRGGNYEPEERIRYDIYYIQNWNIFLDFSILIYSLFSFKNAF